MSNSTEKLPSSLEIFQTGYRRILPSGSSEIKRFFTALRNTILREYQAEGVSPLTEQLLQDPPRTIDAVVCSALMDVYNVLTTGSQPIEAGLTGVVPYIAESTYYMSRTVTWSQCDRINKLTIPVDSHIMEMVALIRKAGKGYHRPDPRKTEEPELKTPATASAPVSESLQSAHEVKEEADNSLAKERSQRILSEAREDARQLRSEGEKIRTTARTEADQILADARSAAKAEAEQILLKARAEAARIRSEAEAYAQDTRNAALHTAEQAAQQRSRSLLQRYISADQTDFRRTCREEISDLVEQNIEASGSADQRHAEICDRTNHLQANIIKALEDAAQQIAGTKAELYKHLHDWQVALYPKEIRPIADRFLELYRIINVDKIIRDEILFQDARGSEPAPGTLEALQKLNKTLTTFLRRYELALNGLGLYAYYPAEGEPFDELWHVPEDDDDEDPAGRKVAACVIPGIAKQTVDQGEDDVLIPAVVRIHA